jgi:hypothetical protein
LYRNLWRALPEGSRSKSALPSGRLRASAAEDTFEVIAVATGLLFRFSLMRIGVTMFPTRVGVVTCIEAVSFGTRLAVRSPILSRRVALHAALPPPLVLRFSSRRRL